MEFIVILVIAALIVVSLKIFNTKLNPLFIFLLLWGIITFFSFLKKYYLYKASSLAYTIILVGILGYSLGCLLGSRTKQKEPLQAYDDSQLKIRLKIIYVLSAVTIILFVKDYFSVRSVMPNASLSDVRALSQDNKSVLYINQTTIEKTLRSFIVEPFTFALQPIVALEIINKKHHALKLLVLDIIICLLRMLSQGSRSLFMYLGIHLIMAFILAYSNNRNTDLYIKLKKRKKCIYSIGILFIIVFLWASSQRSGDRLFRNLYYNYSMEPYLMEKWLGEIKTWGYGTASLNGFVYPIIYIIKNLFNLSYPEPWYSNVFLLLSNTDQIWQIIAMDGTKANAYVSIFFFPYVDGGILGEFVIMLLVGLLGGFLYRNRNREPVGRNSALYLYFLQGIIMSFVRLQFANITYALGFVALLILLSKKRINA